MKIKDQKRQLRKRRVRAKVFGTAKRPRMSVYKSLNNCYIQLIDDGAKKTLLAMDDRQYKGAKAKRAEQLGDALAKAAIKAGIEVVVFDRGGFRYHGRIKALAEAARAAGLKF